MAKYELKTQKNDGDVQAFLSTIDNEQKFVDNGGRDRTEAGNVG